MTDVPFKVVLNTHVPGKGYSLSVLTNHVEMQVYVSEKGRVIRAYEPRPKPPSRGRFEVEKPLASSRSEKA